MLEPVWERSKNKKGAKAFELKPSNNYPFPFILMGIMMTTKKVREKSKQYIANPVKTTALIKSPL